MGIEPGTTTIENCSSRFEVKDERFEIGEK